MGFVNLKTAQFSNEKTTTLNYWKLKSNLYIIDVAVVAVKEWERAEQLSKFSYLDIKIRD